MINFGCDPEFFFVTNVNNKDYVISPALLNKFGNLNFISGDTKHPVFFENEDFKWMMDGVAAEITIKKPYKNPVKMFNIIQDAYGCLQEIASKVNFNFMGNKLDISAFRKPVVDIFPEWYEPFLSDEQIWQGFIYGCDQDFDAEDTNWVQTADARKDKFRYGGGHHHISGDKLFYDYILPAIKLAAIYVGTFCIENSPYPELEIQRGQVYGRPVRFRPQKYPSGECGMEYRTPSNSWTNFEECLIEEMFSKYYVIKDLLHNENKAVDILNNFYKLSAIAIINGDTETCSIIQKEIK